MKKLLIAVAIGLAAGVVAGYFLGLVSPGSPATQETIVNVAAATGGIGSALGGIAAAVAAVMSNRSATKSSDAASELRKIGETSRRALGLAVKPIAEIHLYLGRDGSYLSVASLNEWGFRNLEVEVEVPGAQIHRAGPISEVPGQPTSGHSFEGLPAFTTEVDAQAKPEDEDEQFRRVWSKVTVRYTDQQSVIHHEKVYSAETLISKRPDAQLHANRVNLLSEVEENA